MHQRMKRLAAVLCSLTLCLSLTGCGGVVGELVISLPTGEDEVAFYEDLNLCLGDLLPQVSQAEYTQLARTFSPIWKARQRRLNKGKAEMGVWEKALFRQFSSTLDQLILKYCGEVDYYYGDEPEYDLVTYPVRADGSLGTPDYEEDWEDFSYTQEELLQLWQLAGEFLPDDALLVFDTYSLFTDGTDGVVAYVYWDQVGDDPNQLTWGLALDPEDTLDTEYFQETLLHEYFHYLSLNATQVDYTGGVEEDTYSEPDYAIYTLPDSYLNQFYEAFWSPILKDERAVNPDSLYFFLRHYDDFYDDYATTDPTEDIAECFSCYVLMEDGWYDDNGLPIWEQKIAWFDQFPELRTFKEEILEKLEG